MRLIGDDIALTIAFGGVQSAAGPTWGTAVNVKPIGIDFSADDKLTTVKFKAFGDTRGKYRGSEGETTVSLSFYVPDAGPMGAGKIGQYVKVVLTPLSSVTSNSETYIGLLSDRRITGTAGQEQKETFEIMCDAE